MTALRGEFRTLGEVLDAAAEQHGDHEAYVEPGRARITFAEFARASDGLAGALAARGIGHGDVVALMLPSSIDFAVCYAAAARLGAVTTGLNTRLGPREVAAVLERARPALVIRDAGAGLPEPPAGIPVLARTDLAATYDGPGLAAPVGVAPTDPVVIIWTSGTTGTPKGAWFDSRNLAAAATAAGVMSAPYDRRLVATPFAHAGYLAKLWDQLAWGITMVISPVPWSAPEMARILREERITVAGGVPTQWAKLLEEPETGPLPHLRVGIAATAPAPPELVEKTAARLGVPLVVRYAMTESPTICGTEPDDPPEIQFRTVGRPQEGTELLLTDDAGRPVPAGEVGRVRVRGGCVMRGYWNQPELTAEVLTPDGWLISGDFGSFDATGNLVLSGRASDVYIRGGYNVYPLEVENVLSQHPGVAKVAVVGAPAPVIGEIGVAFVVPANPASPPTRDVLRGWTRERLADYKAPDRVEIVPELPLTAMLKVDRHALRARC
ncbi:acyl--CoA ligase [Amycolatopsis acidiphila]|uniref:class I adenylate-forming enzyme family protein n=1 Tax=Amycolatopsis acidiphila TaxID=715473 RepID=UPI00164382CD|nr:class I adenylate-forming enzyme family protein [Amycolatopsis acidiphila]UIJ63265.1 acyl--CoA ligase [Amycolatopsis acidiphila]GHG74677.1 fatty acid--CoA ligase [Amycolatopsis acidiphila]